jgi:hypothetical protein
VKVRGDDEWRCQQASEKESYLRLRMSTVDMGTLQEEEKMLGQSC